MSHRMPDRVHRHCLTCLFVTCQYVCIIDHEPARDFVQAAGLGSCCLTIADKHLGKKYSGVHMV